MPFYRLFCALPPVDSHHGFFFKWVGVASFPPWGSISKWGIKETWHPDSNSCRCLRSHRRTSPCGFCMRIRGLRRSCALPPFTVRVWEKSVHSNRNGDIIYRYLVSAFLLSFLQTSVFSADPSLSASWKTDLTVPAAGRSYWRCLWDVFVLSKCLPGFVCTLRNFFFMCSISRFWEWEKPGRGVTSGTQSAEGKKSDYWRRPWTLWGSSRTLSSSLSIGMTP